MALSQISLNRYRRLIEYQIQGYEKDRRSNLAKIAEAAVDRRDVGDVCESAKRESELAIIAASAAEASRSLARAQRALKRIVAGTYGECVGCGMDIPTQRLDAIPFATRCLSCQEQLE